ncbi:hypothetical protein Areg01_02570 [Actinoplanes regularis]|nr:hypothetical protein Are01nite_16080 [Actinoplanes regularis]GLW27316.1 hypothetical protein Areg01_02570 [Actinoplanes regularis]
MRAVGHGERREVRRLDRGRVPEVAAAGERGLVGGAELGSHGGGLSLAGCRRYLSAYPAIYHQIRWMRDPRVAALTEADVARECHSAWPVACGRDPIGRIGEGF